MAYYAYENNLRRYKRAALWITVFVHAVLLALVFYNGKASSNQAGDNPVRTEASVASSGHRPSP